MDRYEVTNQRFKEFVEAGGYQKPDYWQHKFVKDGRQLDWSEAMKLFVDQTGRPGPATWKDGDFPKGQEQYPVGGVSWYEAAAYAEWAGKRLPTVYHWSLAAGDTMWSEVAFIAPLSNFGGKGPAPAGIYQGMTRKGVYDMAGNVNEWCFNDAQDGCRFTAGGSWDSSQCAFGEADKKPPFSREADVGFRCIKLSSDEGAWKQAGSPIQLSALLDPADQKPCSDEVFAAYRGLYDYNRAALEPNLEEKRDLSPDTHWERVSFKAAYGNERQNAHLFLPLGASKPPFQTLVNWIMTTNVDVRKVVDSLPSHLLEVVAKSGRVFVQPVLRGGWPTNATATNEVIALVDAIRLVQDYKRTLDYLETRPADFDTSKLAYEGWSWGAIMGGIVSAVEPRLKVSLLSAGGLYPGYPKQCNQINFAPRIRIPTLLQGGEYDPIYPLETSQKPYFRLFGTADKDKQHKIYGTGHYLWSGHQWIKEQLEFLDQHLGCPAN